VARRVDAVLLIFRLDGTSALCALGVWAVFPDRFGRSVVPIVVVGLRFPRQMSGGHRIERRWLLSSFQSFLDRSSPKRCSRGVVGLPLRDAHARPDSSEPLRGAIMGAAAGPSIRACY